MRGFFVALSLAAILVTSHGFSLGPSGIHRMPLLSSQSEDTRPFQLDRRQALSSGIGFTTAALATVLGGPGRAQAESPSTDDFASIAARASQIQADLSQEATASASKNRSDKTAYDFDLPLQGRVTPLADIIQQQFPSDEENTTKGPKVKAIVVVNIKQDDPMARRTIPELISLAAKYGRGNEPSLAILASPTDQGYYEPDTSQLIRLKLASEYGYGINPSTVVTDKVNLLGTGAHPFWRWLQSNCRTPAGIGRIEGNFEKFLIDGRTGQPLRRYPRKYSPLSMEEDIAAVIAGRPLPPPRANWMEEWREAAADARTNTYRFEKGLNYFDQ